MAIATAEKFRSRTILVPVLGTDMQFQCRRPDPLALIADGLLPLDTFAAVIEQLHEVAGANILDNRDQQKVTDYKTFSELVDRWVTAAVTAPKVVLTEEELATSPGALWVGEIDAEIRLEIMRRTSLPFASPRVKTAVADFRRQQPAGASAGSNGASVRGAAVDAAGGV